MIRFGKSGMYTMRACGLNMYSWEISGCNNSGCKDSGWNRWEISSWGNLGSRYFNRGLESNAGNAMLEFLIALLFIVPLLLGLIDVSQTLVRFIAFQQVAVSAAEDASNLPLIFESIGKRFVNTDTAANIEACRKLDEKIATGTCEHAFLQSRTRRMISALQMTGYSVSNESMRIESEFIPSNSASGLDNVQISIRTDLDGLLGKWPLRVNRVSPWLFAERSSL